MTVVSMRQPALRSGDLGESQIDDGAKDPGQGPDPFGDLDHKRPLAPDSVSAKTGVPYAEIIRQHGIVRFEFSYANGAFHALDAAGEVLASGETIRELLDSL